jgi:uncharacterized pyridoxamine 5'-phosphate oxidase family protein
MQDHHALCSDLSCNNKDHEGLCRNNGNYNWVRVKGGIIYRPKIFIKIGMEMKEMYFKKRPERVKAFH